MKRWIKALVILFGLIFVYQLVGSFFFIIGFVVYGDIEAIPGNVNVIGLIATQLIMLGLVFLMFKDQNFKTYVRFKPISRHMVLWSVIGGVAILPISTLLIQGMHVVMPSVVDGYIELMEQSLGGANLVITLISVAILAPLVEEVMMRGVLFRQLETATVRPVLVVLLSGLIFGIFHLNIVQGVFTTVAGVLFALAFLWTRSLFVPILMHLGSNLFAVLIGEIPEMILESTWFNVIFYMMIVFLPMALYIFYKERFVEPVLTVKSDDF